jgi:hypothetical protein
MTSTLLQCRFEEATSPGLSLPEMMYWIENKLTSFPACDECGGAVRKFNSFVKGYTQRFCSVACKAANENVKQKVANTCMERFGVANASSAPSVKSRRRETFQQRYNSTGPMNGSLRAKTERTFDARYGGSPMADPSILRKTHETKRLTALSAVPTEFLVLDKSTYLATGARDIQVRHTCGRIFVTRSIHKLICPVCAKRGARSKLEVDLAQQLALQGVQADLGKQLRLKNGSRIYPDLLVDKLVIEIDGNYWHSTARSGDPKKSFMRQQQLKEIGYRSLFFFEDELLFKRDIVTSIITAKLGKFDRRVPARSTTLIELDSKTAAEFSDTYHLQGHSRTSVYLGLVLGDELIGLVSGGRARFSKNGHELVRMCFKRGVQVIGGASKLTAGLKQKLRTNTLITYADHRYSDGEAYAKLGVKVRDNPPGYFYVHRTNFLLRHNRLGFQRHLLAPCADDASSEEELARKMGYFRLWDCGSSTWHI